MDLPFLVRSIPELLGGARTTLWLSAVSIAFGVVLGLLFGVASVCPVRALNLLARAYADTIRGTPLLVQIFIL